MKFFNQQSNGFTAHVHLYNQNDFGQIVIQFVEKHYYSQF